MNTQVTADVAIIGGGPAGLTAATALAKDDSLKVLVLERESAAGGIPRHSDHLGYGIRDMKTFITGPAYARRLVEKAIAAGVDICTNTMVTGWSGERSLDATSPQGLQRIDARAVIVATGARERPRPARMIPGDRSSGIYTTGYLQNLVHVQHRDVGRRAVVVGAELVSWSAVLTLKHAGCHTALMTTTYPSPESYAVFNIAGRSPILGVDVATRTRVTRIIGKPALQAVEIENLDTGERRIIDCDTLVLTGDWIPDHELARSAGLDMDPKTLGPVVDTALRTSTARRLCDRQPDPPRRHRRHRRPRRQARRRPVARLPRRADQSIRRCPHPRRTTTAMDHTRDPASRRRSTSAQTAPAVD